MLYTSRYRARAPVKMNHSSTAMPDPAASHDHDGCWRRGAARNSRAKATTTKAMLSGHRSSVLDGVTGVLVEPAELGRAVADVLTDDRRRHALAAAALARARTLTWEASALGITSCLHAEVVRKTGAWGVSG